MEILDNVIEKLKELESQYGDVIFPIRRLAESEKCRQLKEGTRIKVNPLEYSCSFCVHYFNDPEKFFLHLVQKHLTPGDKAREIIDEQQQTYQKEIGAFETLINKHTEVMLDVNYTDETRDT